MNALDFLQKSKYAVLSRHIPMVIVKKEEGPYWPRLLKDMTKVSFNLYSSTQISARLIFTVRLLW